MKAAALHTIDEVAEQLRLHPKTVAVLVRRGDIASFRVGNGPKAPYRITQAHVDAFLAKRFTPAGGAR